MPNTFTNNKRIAKNTLLLYIRMLFLMLVSLYTSRVVLNALGVNDYGIYSVVGGVVLMFNIISGSLNAAISRFITFELGSKNLEKLKRVFSSSITIQLVLALIIIILAETIGLLFLNYRMEIPEGRLSAANWCFQFSVLTFSVNLISVPYNAAIIAHEHMSAFAYISILDGICKLLIAWGIVFSTVDKLIIYAGLLALLACTIRVLYGIYCKRHFEECKYHFALDFVLLKQMFSFAGWNFFGVGSFQLMTQGVNLLSNLYFGVTVNAARGLATQVEHAVAVFVSNFVTAFNPQITKSYASNEKEYMFSLMFSGARYSFFLLLYLAIPLLFETKQILKLWLITVPDYTVSFVRLTVISTMVSSLSNTMITAMLATGNIKKYQIIVGGIGMFVFPLVWLLFVMGFPPETAYVVTIIICIVQLVCRLYLMNEMIGMSINRFLREVLYKVLLTSIIICPLPFIICYLADEDIIRFIAILILSVILTTLTVLFIGLTSTERNFVYNRLKCFVDKVHKQYMYEK